MCQNEDILTFINSETLHVQPCVLFVDLLSRAVFSTAIELHAYPAYIFVVFPCKFLG
jgi:hypothetical protein